MEFITYQSPSLFYEDTKFYLHKHEVSNILPIGLLRQAKANQITSECFYCLGKEANDIKLIMMVQGLHLILVTEDDSCLEEAATFMDLQSIAYPGIIGSRPFVDIFVEALNRKSNHSFKLRMAQRIYRLDQVNPIHYSQGDMRLATLDDLDTITDWSIEFSKGEGMDYDRESTQLKRKLDIENKRLFLWCVEGQPVTMTNISKSSGDGVIVSIVYTPKEHRKKGYATSLVARVSAHALSHYKYCALYTDLGNPVSNSIYMKIGYKAVTDSALYLKA